ncbi:U-box domain-containing protein 52-like [Macadamia integrifolia]|uniref:U-box domain-containing protein 52-like n=1 Tax=Macadamia integrifolia TaxID=60698 RepID=UPI001C4F11D5|nr:U-box domain-containing protein 52-like [Macadamia integrifolia]
MAPPLSEGISPVMNTRTVNITVAVAIDKDKNSQYAVKWAIDHLLKTNPNIILIHVINRVWENQGLGLNEASPDDYRETTEDVHQLFLPYRGYCARKGVKIREVVLDDFDISKAIIDYLNLQCINNVVVGASSKNSITRKFRNPYVATCLIKSAPDFCTVYVISKGKVASIRSANRLPPLNVMNNATPIELQSPRVVPQLQTPETPVIVEGIKRTPTGNTGEKWKKTGVGRRVLERSMDRELVIKPPRSRNSIENFSSMEHLGFATISLDYTSPMTRNSSRESISLDRDFSSSSLCFRSMDMDSENDFGIGSGLNSPIGGGSFNANSSRDMEAEMKRLRQELKQTMDMYTTACREAISAKQKAKEIHQWKIEERHKFEDTRHAEEAALAMAEMEKAKCRAAIEAAQTAQKLAEKEASRRKQAELKAQRESEERMRALAALENIDIRYRKYAIEEIEAATDSFAEGKKIGEGGYGPVYKALLDHTPVAIKVLRPDAQHGRQQFQQEIEVLSSIRHPNMVLLLGACPEYGCLVYEHMENGSLEDRLFRRGNTPSIPWGLRFKIAAEIATGLNFLHQSKPEPLVHRDLKPANILLDRNYVSKISDVGLARLVPPSVADCVTQYRITSAAGTFCYIDPEYQKTGMLGVKSDIYSLGIMLLQIITALPAMGLSHKVEKAIKNGVFDDILDPTVSDWPVEEALEFAKVALQCAELRRRDRPDLTSVVLPILNRLRDLGHCEAETTWSISSSTILSYGPPSYRNFTRSRSRFSTVQDMSRSNLMGSQRSNLSEKSGNSSSPRPVNGNGELVPRRLVALEDGSQCCGDI